MIDQTVSSEMICLLLLRFFILIKTFWELLVYSSSIQSNADIVECKVTRWQVERKVFETTVKQITFHWMYKLNYSKHRWIFYSCVSFLIEMNDKRGNISTDIAMPKLFRSLSILLACAWAKNWNMGSFRRHPHGKHCMCIQSIDPSRTLCEVPSRIVTCSQIYMNL